MIPFEYAMFDMDGTLIDTMEYWRNSVIEYATRRGYQFEQSLLDEIRKMSCNSGIEYCRDVFKGTKLADVTIYDIMDIMNEHYINDAKFKDGSEELLEYLRECGIKMCLITASPKIVVDTAIEKMDFGKYFDFVMTWDDFPNGKKDAEVFGIMLERFKTTPDKTAIFEDALYAIETVTEMGFYTVGIEDSTQTDDREKIKEHVDLYCTTPREALEYFKESNNKSEKKAQ